MGSTASDEGRSLALTPTHHRAAAVAIGELTRDTRNGASAHSDRSRRRRKPTIVTVANVSRIYRSRGVSRAFSGQS